MIFRPIYHRRIAQLADAITTWFYEDDNFKTFNGYRLSAIDASILEINNSERLRDEFGCYENKTKKSARAMSSGIYDIENDMMITSIITKYDSGERDVAIELIEKLKVLGLKNDLILFDRGYPSANFFSYLKDNGINFVIRTRNNFFSKIDKTQESDQIVEVTADGKTIKLRVLRFMLDSGIEEVLATSLFDESLGIQDFKKLYFKRW